MKQNMFDALNRIRADEKKEYTLQLPMNKDSKYAIFSDLHMQNGNPHEDTFARNRNAFKAALKHYEKNEYSIILLGDIEDFHQHTMLDIYSAYEDIYKILQNFNPGKIYRIYGNHDIEWAIEDPISGRSQGIATEAIKLGDHIILTHGHQAQEFYEKDLQTVRVFTFIGKYYEKLFGSNSESSVTQYPSKKDEIYFDWAEAKKKILICGHTHTPIFASQPLVDLIPQRKEYLSAEFANAKKNENKEQANTMYRRIKWLEGQEKLLEWQKEKNQETLGDVYRRDIILNKNSPYYFNTGSGIFSDGITNIEIEGAKIRMTFWNREDNERDVITNDTEKDMNSIIAGAVL